MDVISLKKYIYENEKIEYILKEIGCHHIQYHDKGYYSCANFDGDNVSAINVWDNEYLNIKNWTRENDFDSCSDLITLIEYNKQISFYEAIKYTHKILGLDFKWKKKPKQVQKVESPLKIFTDHIENKNDVNDIRTIDEQILNDYTPLLYIGWFREGVMPWTAKKFGIAYSYRRNRVIIPMRYWLTGELLGINSRTTIDCYQEFGIKKFYITPSYQKSLNLFGLWEHKNDIEKAGYVVVYEAEKSVLKRDSLNDPTGVALSGHTMSDEQAAILRGLNVDIIIAMDNDVHIDEIRYMCEKLRIGRNVSYIKDKWDLLGEKDSPADAKNKVFQFLLKRSVTYDDTEHKKYEQSLKRR